LDKTRRWADKPEVKTRTNKLALKRYHKNKATISVKINCSRLEVRKKVILHYGGRCACCGEDGLQFLTMDHKHGDGAKRRKIGEPVSGYGLCLWIIRNNYPEDMQVLCFNCNMAKRTGIACPHQSGTVIHLTVPIA
jgi:hypothetical protein